MTIDILGIPYEVKEVEVIDEGFEGIVHGKIYESKQEIHIRKSTPKELKEETLCHEVVHGVLNHLGYYELNSDETFVQGFANAIYQIFQLKK